MKSKSTWLLKFENFCSPNPTSTKWSLEVKSPESGCNPTFRFGAPYKYSPLGLDVAGGFSGSFVRFLARKVSERLQKKEMCAQEQKSWPHLKPLRRSDQRKPGQRKDKTHGTCCARGELAPKRRLEPHDMSCGSHILLVPCVKHSNWCSARFLPG